MTQTPAPKSGQRTIPSVAPRKPNAAPKRSPGRVDSPMRFPVCASHDMNAPTKPVTAPITAVQPIAKGVRSRSRFRDECARETIQRRPTRCTEPADDGQRSKNVMAERETARSGTRARARTYHSRTEAVCAYRASRSRRRIDGLIKASARRTHLRTRLWVGGREVEEEAGRLRMSRCGA